MGTEKPAARYLVILLVAAGLLGIYKVVTAACISNDSVLFLEFADQLAISPVKAIRSYDQHPGFPMMLYAARQVLQIFCGPILSAEEKILLGQGIVLLCRLLTLAAVYLIFTRFSRRQAAFLNTFFVLLIPKYANHGSDVLSDWPALLFEALSLLLCLKGIASLRRRYFFVAGAAAGAAYWIRPEGLIFVPVLWIYILIRCIRFSDNRRSLCLCGLAMTLAALAVISPYIAMKGAIFPKKDLGDFTQEAFLPESGPAAAGSPWAAGLSHPASAAAIPRAMESVFHFLEEAANLLLLMIVPWGFIIIRNVLSFWRNSPPRQFLVVFILLWIILLVGLHAFTGYLSNRHLMPLVVFSFGWVWEGIVRLLGPLAHPPRRLRTYVLLFSALALLPWIVKLPRPLHADKDIYKQAGLWLRQAVPPEHRLAVFDNRIGFYAQRRYKMVTANLLHTAEWAVLSNPPDPSFPLPPQAVRIKTGIPRMEERMQIFRLPPGPPSLH